MTLTLQPTLADIQQPIQERQLINFGFTDLDTGVSFPPTVGVIQLPEIEITTVRSTVSIPDKGTLLIGGQRLVGEAEVEAGVPVLSKIPLVNRLFTNTSSVKDQRTLLILVKPTIILQNEQEELLFPGLEEDPAAYNVGNRF